MRGRKTRRSSPSTSTIRRSRSTATSVTFPKHTFLEIQRFFTDYKKLENKEVVVDQIVGAAKANEAIRESFALYRKVESELRGWK
jgi:inorganic pyrophosphatase